MLDKTMYYSLRYSVKNTFSHMRWPIFVSYNKDNRKKHIIILIYNSIDWASRFQNKQSFPRHFDRSNKLKVNHIDGLEMINVNYVRGNICISTKKVCTKNRIIYTCFTESSLCLLFFICHKSFNHCQILSNSIIMHHT